MGVAGSIFELHPPNFVRIHIFMSCKNAEIFVMISQVVSDLAKISVSQTSISETSLNKDTIQYIYTFILSLFLEPFSFEHPSDNDVLFKNHDIEGKS